MGLILYIDRVLGVSYGLMIILLFCYWCSDDNSDVVSVKQKLAKSIKIHIDRKRKYKQKHKMYINIFKSIYLIFVFIFFKTSYLLEFDKQKSYY